MGIISTKVGNAEVLIETVELSERNRETAFPGMRDTAAHDFVTEHVLNIFDNAREVIRGIADELSSTVAQAVNPPDETKISFGMSLSAEGNTWLVKGGSNMTINVQMTWKRCEKNEES